MTTMIQHLKKVLTVALLSAVITTGGNLFAQSISPNNPNNGNALWQTDGKDTVMTNRFVKVNNSMRVLGPLHVGKNSLTLLGLGSTTSDDITSTNGVILFGGAPTFSNIRVGIGTATPASGNALDVFGSIALFGYRVLASPNPTNIFVGKEAGFSTPYSAEYNSFLGSYSGYSNTSGANNSFFGANSGFNNTSGFENSFLGAFAGYSNLSGYRNSFLGFESGYLNTNGSQNSFVGYRSGYSNTTGSYNSFFGS